MVYTRTEEESDLQIPNREDFRAGYESFRGHDPRDAMYKVATFLVSHFFGNFREMSNGLGVLLLTWNQGYYRYGGLSFDELEECLQNNWDTIKFFRNKEVLSLSESDRGRVKDLFDKFLIALQRIDNKGSDTRSPVAVAKALHLLAPGFFPLWDHEIALAYRCNYSKKPADKYLLFCDKMKTVAEAVKNYDNIPKDVTILKLIDEYNFAKYTKNWV